MSEKLKVVPILELLAMARSFSTCNIWNDPMSCVDLSAGRLLAEQGVQMPLSISHNKQTSMVNHNA